MIQRLLVVALAVLPSAVFACGVTIEDKVAATYDERAAPGSCAERTAPRSFALDPQAQTPEIAVAAIEHAAKTRGLKLTLLKVVH